MLKFYCVGAVMNSARQAFGGDITSFRILKFNKENSLWATFIYSVNLFFSFNLKWLKLNENIARHFPFQNPPWKLILVLFCLCFKINQKQVVQASAEFIRHWLLPLLQSVMEINIFLLYFYIILWKINIFLSMKNAQFLKI